MTDTISELNNLMSHERDFYRDIETQFADFDKKQLAVIGGSRDTDFLLAFLYEAYSGQLYGDRCLVRVYLVDSRRNLKKAEFVYASIWTSGLPLFDGLILTSEPEKALPEVEYVIIHPYVKWKKDLNRERIIEENFHFLRRLADCITDYCRQDVHVLLIGSCCMIPFRLILALYLPNLPMSQVHGVTRSIERAAASLIANRLQCNSNEIRGVAVFGEDIVEVFNAWQNWSPDCDADLLDMDTIKYGDSALREWFDLNEEIKETEKTLQMPQGMEVIGLHPLDANADDMMDLPPLVGDVDQHRRSKWLAEDEEGAPEEEREEAVDLEFQTEEQQDVEEKRSDEIKDKTTSPEELDEFPQTEQVLKEESGDEWKKSLPIIKLRGPHTQDISDQIEKTKESPSLLVTNENRKKPKTNWDQWMKDRYQQDNKKKPNLKWTFWDDLFFEERSAAVRFREISGPWQCRVYPKALRVPEEEIQSIKGQKTQRKDCRVMANIKDEKFLKGTIFKKCRHSMSGFAYSKAVINYIKKVLLSEETVYTNEIVCSPGIYGIPSGFFASFPVRIDDKNCNIIKGYTLSVITIHRIEQMVKKLIKDYDQVFALFYNYPPREVKRLWQLRREEEEGEEEQEEQQLVKEGQFEDIFQEEEEHAKDNEEEQAKDEEEQAKDEEEQAKDDTDESEKEETDDEL